MRDLSQYCESESYSVPLRRWLPASKLLQERLRAGALQLYLLPYSFALGFSGSSGSPCAPGGDTCSQSNTRSIIRSMGIKGSLSFAPILAERGASTLQRLAACVLDGFLNAVPLAFQYLARQRNRRRISSHEVGIPLSAFPESGDHCSDEFTFHLHVAPFFNVAAKSAKLPNETQRCHSVRDSHTPSEFFHERCVATENAVNVDPLLIVFVSACPPMNPTRVSLLRYMLFFLFCPCVLGHSGARGLRSQGKKLLFWGARMGEPEPDGVVRRSRGFEDRRARELARSCAQDQKADQENDCS
jgi:hypothetical protein